VEFLGCVLVGYGVWAILGFFYGLKGRFLWRNQMAMLLICEKRELKNGVAL